MEARMIAFFRQHLIALSLASLAIALFCGITFWIWGQQADLRTPLNLSDAGGLYDAEADNLANTVYAPGVTASSITGLPCDAFDQRPLAVMYDGLPDARGIATGITDASFVLEMAHRYPSGATQMMGVFDCAQPFNVGPLGSGRVDFLDVARSFDAIYVANSGDSIVGSLLTEGVQNHIDCSGDFAPSGSAESCVERSLQVDLETDTPIGAVYSYGNALRLYAQSEDIGYPLAVDVSREGFAHTGDVPLSDRPEDGILEVNYQTGFEVTYVYDRRFNRYERFFAGEPEFDAANGKRVAPRNVIIFKSDYAPFSADTDYAAAGLRDPWQGAEASVRFNEDGLYANLALGDPWFDTESNGWAHFYIGGEEIVGTWSRNPDDSRAPFTFLDNAGQPIVFVPGQIWMHVLEPSRNFRWL